MKMINKAFAKKLFGTKYERLTKSFCIWLLVFAGLRIADVRVEIAPFIRYLMTGTFTAGVMWQALSSKNNADSMQNMFMIPFEGREFIFSYTASLGAYTIFTKTAALLSVLFAVSVWNPAEICIGILCAVDAALITAAIFSTRKYWYAGGLWGAAAIAVVLFTGNGIWIALFLIGNGILAVMILRNADGYSFYLEERENGHAIKGHKRHCVWRYFFRYLMSHKNYLWNTIILWCVAFILPFWFKQMGNLSVIPIGFAILSFNTPVCILLSCAPALEQAVRFLPNQKKAFCIPYCLFLFTCNLAADVIFLSSWQIQNSGVTVSMILTAVLFAMQSAVCSVLLEWFYPVRGWKIESDLWHHPRKYIVPAVMLLLAGAVGTLPMLLIVPALIVLPAVEIVVLLFA